MEDKEIRRLTFLLFDVYNQNVYNQNIIYIYNQNVYNQNIIDRWTKGCILPFSQKGDLGIVKNYRGITLIPIAAKIYYAPQRNCIEPKIEKILRKNQNGFWRNRSKASKVLTICRVLEGVRAKKTSRQHYYL